MKLGMDAVFDEICQLKKKLTWWCH